jgi:hypothetical protein
MFAAYVIVTLLAAAANAFSATLDFIQFKQVLVNMAKVGGPESSITLLGILKAAGVLGSLVGIFFPVICRGDRHPPARRRFFGRPSGCIPSVGHGSAGAPTRDFVSIARMARASVTRKGRTADRPPCSTLTGTPKISFMPGLEQFADNVWTMDGPPVYFIGLAFPTRMIIVRLVDGSLWVNSPVGVRSEMLDGIKAWET